MMALLAQNLQVIQVVGPTTSQRFYVVYVHLLQPHLCFTAVALSFCQLVLLFPLLFCEGVPRVLLPFKVLPDLLDQLAKRLAFEGDLVPVAQVPDLFVAYCFGVVGVQDKQKVFTQERVLVPFGSWCHLYADNVELLVFHGGDDVVEFNYLVKLFIQVVLVVDYDTVLVLFVPQVGNRDVFKNGPCEENVLFLLFPLLLFEHLGSHVYFYLPCLFHQCLDSLLLRNPVHVVVHTVVHKSGVVSTGGNVFCKALVHNIESVAAYVEMPTDILHTVRANTICN